MAPEPSGLGPQDLQTRQSAAEAGSGCGPSGSSHSFTPAFYSTQVGPRLGLELNASRICSTPRLTAGQHDAPFRAMHTSSQNGSYSPAISLLGAQGALFHLPSSSGPSLVRGPSSSASALQAAFEQPRSDFRDGNAFGADGSGADVDDVDAALPPCDSAFSAGRRLRAGGDGCLRHSTDGDAAGGLSEMAADAASTAASGTQPLHHTQKISSSTPRAADAGAAAALSGAPHLPNYSFDHRSSSPAAASPDAPSFHPSAIFAAIEQHPNGRAVSATDHALAALLSARGCDDRTITALLLELRDEGAVRSQLHALVDPPVRSCRSPQPQAAAPHTDAPRSSASEAAADARAASRCAEAEALAQSAHPPLDAVLLQLLRGAHRLGSDPLDAVQMALATHAAMPRLDFGQLVRSALCSMCVDGISAPVAWNALVLTEAAAQAAQPVSSSAVAGLATPPSLHGAPQEASAAEQQAFESRIRSAATYSDAAAAAACAGGGAGGEARSSSGNSTSQPRRTHFSSPPPPPGMPAPPHTRSSVASAHGFTREERCISVGLHPSTALIVPAWFSELPTNVATSAIRPPSRTYVALLDEHLRREERMTDRFGHSKPVSTDHLADFLQPADSRPRIDTSLLSARYAMSRGAMLVAWVRLYLYYLSERGSADDAANALLSDLADAACRPQKSTTSQQVSRTELNRLAVEPDWQLEI